ncbi:MAG: nodulation protein NfeD [Anaerolineales bacterium]|nr:nodulation protein NfeD [Anaerolineales bacterium]
MIKRVFLLIWFILFSFGAASALGRPARAQGETPLVLVLNVEGPITPSIAEYLERGIRSAENDGAELLVVQLNTPGGSIDIMQDMVENIRGSDVPVVVYVAPRGAIAGSAGTVITLAAHAAAMAPETVIGAASPVGGQGEDLGETIEDKQKNILKAIVRSLTERRGLDASDLAEDTIETAIAASATEALEVGLIDFIANDLDDLLHQLDGYTVQVQGSERTLTTENAEVSVLEPNFIERFLHTLTNPNIVFLLLTIGVQAILIELSSPGGWIAGFIGVVCLALATYGLGILPVNWFGLIFLATAFVLFFLDIKAPTHGALTAAGIVSLIIGALVLFNSPSVPSFQRVSVPLVVGTSIATGALFFGILLFAIRAQKTPIRTGQESLIGRVGAVRFDLNPAGSVKLGGELWTAELTDQEDTAPQGTRVEVVRVEGLKLFVRKVDE